MRYNVKITRTGYDLTLARHELERQLLALAIDEADGNKSVAARVLGVSRPKFYKMLQTHGMSCNKSDILFTVPPAADPGHISS